MGTHRISRYRTATGAALIALCLGPAAPPARAQEATAPATAVTVPSGPITLEQALTLAEAQSETVASAQAGIRRAEGEEIRARATLYPQLSASLGYDRSLASEFDGVFDSVDFGGSGGSGGTPEGDDGLDDLPFGRANTWRATLTFSQSVYSGGRLGAARQLAAANRDAAGHALTAARAQLLFDVTQAYYDAALSARLVSIAEATVQQAGATLQQTQAGFDAGTQPEFEVLRARVNRDNQTPLVIRARVNRDVALLRLKQLLELPADADLQLAESFADDSLAPPPVFAPQVARIENQMLTVDWAAFTRVAAADLPQRNAVTEAATGVALREAALKLAEAEKNPSVSLNSAYSRIGYPNNVFTPTFDRSNWTVGATLSVPILTGGRQRGDEVVARAELDQARLQRRQVEELAALDTRSAWAELVAAKAAWEATSGTVQQANRAYEIANVRFGAGVSTQLELTDSRLLLQQAEANRAQAARDLQVARARAALLPNLPLGAGAGGGGAAPRTPQALPVPTAPSQNSGQFRNAGNQAGQSRTGTR